MYSKLMQVLTLRCAICCSEGEGQTGVEDQVVKKLEQFNSVCDELYKEIVRLDSWKRCRLNTGMIRRAGD